MAFFAKRIQVTNSDLSKKLVKKQNKVNAHFETEQFMYRIRTPAKPGGTAKY
jgi:hypothetical protein